MSKPVFLAALTIVATPTIFATHDARACSCVPPSPHLLTPFHTSKAPINTNVRIMLPHYSAGSLVLRKHLGPNVSAKRVESALNSISYVELVPDKPLDADTRYELALVRPEQHPSTLVFGTFVTGNATDVVSPSAPKIIRTNVNGHRSSMMTSCSVSTPWAEVFLTPGTDPNRDDAHLMYAVWIPNAKGKIDLEAPPTAYLKEEGGKLKLGRTSYCDPEEFPLPASGSITVGIATTDEAGNRSPLQRVNLVVSK